MYSFFSKYIAEIQFFILEWRWNRILHSFCIKKTDSAMEITAKWIATTHFPIYITAKCAAHPKLNYPSKAKRLADKRRRRRRKRGKERSKTTATATDSQPNVLHCNCSFQSLLHHSFKSSAWKEECKRKRKLWNEQAFGNTRIEQNIISGSSMFGDFPSQWDIPHALEIRLYLIDLDHFLTFEWNGWSFYSGEINGLLRM